ncbi:hypothetical protein OG301_00435 [Streptomyces platensis]|uniref:hypothetical protein n=1 Tax=Streptomyces platensis TaxID=58346 RepID=UPI002ED27905|nr:hypothetical protein OG301_00435 [Streptomyces platensis]
MSETGLIALCGAKTTVHPNSDQEATGDGHEVRTRAGSAPIPQGASRAIGAWTAAALSFPPPRGATTTPPYASPGPC